jgi:hypothetical protein
LTLGCNDQKRGLKTMKPTFFDRLILRLAEPAAVVGLFESRWSLEQRVKRILESERVHMTRSQRGVVLSAFALLATTAVALAAVRPGAKLEIVEEPVGLPVALADGPATVVSGVVVDEAGTPVAGADVVMKTQPAARDVARTGPDGRFTLGIGGPFRYGGIVEARADGGNRYGYGYYYAPPMRPREPIRIVLKPTQTTVVRVVDVAGKPVADAWVGIEGSPPMVGESTRTDEQGIARLRISADRKVQAIVALKDGVGADYFENYQSYPAQVFAPPPPEVSLTLDGARTVRINAIGSDGKGVPGLGFQMWLLNKPGKISQGNLTGLDFVSAMTDAAGTARFAFVPKSARATFSLVSEEDYTGLDSPTVPAGGDDEVTIPVRRNGRMSGRVVQADGTPARGVIVSVGGRGLTASRPSASAPTGSDGTYSLKVAPDQSYMLAVLETEHASAALSGVLVREGQSREGLDLRLIPGTRLHGRVSPVASDMNRLPAPVAITLQGPELPTELQRSPRRKDRELVSTRRQPDAQGHYEARLGPGEYVIRGPDRQNETIRVDGTGELVRDFKAVSVPVILTGSVVDQAGRPVAAALVRTVAIPWQSFEPSEGPTDAAGRFSVSRREHDNALYAKSADGKRAGFIQLAPGAQDVKVSIAPAASVSGRFLDPAGQPFTTGGANLFMIADPEGRAVRQGMGFGKLDRDGRYHFDGLVPGARFEARVLDSRNVPPTRIVKEFTANGPAMIDLGDFNVPDPPADPKKP